MESYGYIETYGYVASVAAADAALKAADVKLTNLYLTKAAILTVEVCGDVAAVRAAVDAGVAEAQRIGKLLGSNVIARVDEETAKILVGGIQETQRKEKKEEAKQEAPIESIKEVVVEEILEELQEEKVESKVSEAVSEEQVIETEKNTEVEEISEEQVENNSEKLRRKYRKMRVIELKQKVNNLKLDYSWNQIKAMTREELIEILLNNK